MITVNNGWLAFELSVLRRLKFRSVALPLTGEPDLGVYLKRWGVEVAANDEARWAHTKARALIENNTERLSELDVETTLEDAYVPNHRLDNAALRRWFGESDAWWFQNVKENIEALEGETTRALALTFGMMVGDYALSFDDETRELRQPLSKIFYRLWKTAAPPVDNKRTNSCYNRTARDFLAEQRADLMFLRLPRPTNSRDNGRPAQYSWREEWLRGTDSFWDEARRTHAGAFGAPVESRQQYLYLLEDLLTVALHLPAWAIAHVDDGFITTQELVECVNRVRKVETVYTKDYSELTGTRAVIITA
ncbi:MAG TPA: hypothetical protein VJS44_14030 [Pyrinomonadaceae bacterium]|nr:hypothetical protein [Pyrinomonadaceae bacterium]